MLFFTQFSEHSYILSAVLSLITALLLSSVGFKKLVYFISIGYGFSIAGIALVISLLFLPVLDMVFAVQAALLLFYGLRLSIYLIRRENRHGYRNEQQDIDAIDSKSSLLKKLGVWVGVSILYAAMSAALLGQAHLRFSGISVFYPLQIAGTGIMLIGLILESLADYQKSTFKISNPGTFCNTGLYRFSRCPNYLGEIVFWTGMFISGIQSYKNLFVGAAALVAYICIVLIMMGSTKRQEQKQSSRYGDRPEYQEFEKTVPVLFPFIPVYTLKNLKVYLE